MVKTPQVKPGGSLLHSLYGNFHKLGALRSTQVHYDLYYKDSQIGLLVFANPHMIPLYFPYQVFRPWLIWPELELH